MNKPPTIPRKSARSVRTGSMSVTATTRGRTSFRIGEAPSARMASTCSVTDMVPSSAVIPEPTRAATMRAVRVGPSSRQIDSTTTRPTNSLPPNCDSAYDVWSARTIPVKRAVRLVIEIDWTPTASIWRRISDVSQRCRASRASCAVIIATPPRWKDTLRTQRRMRASFQSGSFKTATYCVVESNWATCAFYGRGPAVPYTLVHAPRSGRLGLELGGHRAHGDRLRSPRDPHVLDSAARAVLPFLGPPLGPVHPLSDRSSGYDRDVAGSRGPPAGDLHVEPRVGDRHSPPPPRHPSGRALPGETLAVLRAVHGLVDVAPLVRARRPAPDGEGQGGLVRSGPLSCEGRIHPDLPRRDPLARRKPRRVQEVGFPDGSEVGRANRARGRCRGPGRSRSSGNDRATGRRARAGRAPDSHGGASRQGSAGADGPGTGGDPRPFRSGGGPGGAGGGERVKRMSSPPGARARRSET